ncbi:RHS repeat domain-containing protein [Paraburkholderia gardini]|uniref:YD repeat-containing protein n=1 Tax=Paraburkholderia gardini TaxID=2823469 RepID=A0ABM8U474_9BURK|nr:RHS repeat domain-containing protein [Paraburkholderia gardini]CAG4900844.1 hypothetical protein R54767_02680 [Paraburkholderia gardini]
MIDAFPQAAGSLARFCRARLAMLNWSSGAAALACALVMPSMAHADDITYGYDTVGRLTSVTVSGDTAYYDYDAAGNITAIRRAAATSAARDDVLSSPSASLLDAHQGT